MRVSVLTPTIFGRERFLEECVASVEAQVFENYEHLVLLDENYEGCSTTMNRLAEMARGEYLFILADDDLILPRCLEAHWQLRGPNTIVYAPPLVWGEPPDQFRLRPPSIPAVALIPRELWMGLKGYSPALNAQEDRDLFTRAMKEGVNFERASDHPTWIYRFHGGNKSRA